MSRQIAELIVINSVCVVGPTQQRYTLKRRVATATTQITIRAIPRHGKSKSSDYSLLAQFGLTPKSKRGLAAREVVDPLDGV
jgi:hypothetical protein